MAASYAKFISEIPKQEIRDCLAPARRPVEIAVFGSKNSFNLSAIIRTGHNFLVSKYWGIDIESLYEKAMMTARRFDEHLIHLVSVEEFLKQTEGRNIVAFEKRDDVPSIDVRSFQYPENCILLFGSEDDGVPDTLLKRANSVVHIPILGLVNSYNVACAAGMILFDHYCKETL